VGDVGAEGKGVELASEGYFLKDEIIVFVLFVFEVNGNKMVELGSKISNFFSRDKFLTEIAFGFGGFSFEGLRGLNSHMIDMKLKI
jgi:hypothetical protein